MFLSTGASQNLLRLQVPRTKSVLQFAQVRIFHQLGNQHYHFSSRSTFLNEHLFHSRSLKEPFGRLPGIGSINWGAHSRSVKFCPQQKHWRSGAEICILSALAIELEVGKPVSIVFFFTCVLSLSDRVSQLL